MTIQVGTKVEVKTTYKPITGDTWTGTRSWSKFGEVVEIGTGAKAGRVRVKWSHSVWHNGHTVQDGKRTWYNPAKLLIVKE